MSNTGKTTTYIRKTNVKESLVPNVGFKKTRFLHEASEGDTLIQLGSLTVPSGVVNYSAPSVSELTSTNLLQWASNFTLTSSLRGILIQNLSYIINGSSTIKLLFDAEDGEVFEGVIDHNVRTGLTMVDAAPIVVSGTLAAGDTDFNVGAPFAVGQYPSAKRGVLQVEVDGQPVYRTDGNAPFGVGISGDYYEVHSGNGLGQILRFQADLVNDRFIMVTSVGALVEKPNGSVMAAVETVQGQIDALVPTVAELAGVDETDFQAVPNNTDLKSFGDRVFGAEEDIEELETNKQNTLKITYLSDVKPTSTDGGGSTVNVWVTRTLNTQGGDTSFCSLSANQFTLQPGTYDIFARAPAFQVGGHKIRLRNITDGTTDIMGSASASTSAGADGNIDSIVMGVLVLAAAKTYEIQHITNLTNAGDGFGIAVNQAGADEVYTQVKIIKLG